MENSSSDSDFETECENLLRSFDILQVIDDATVQTDSSSSSALVPVSAPLYSESMWAVHSLSGRSNPQYETITSSDFRPTLAFQANPFQRCANSGVLLLAQDQQGLQYLQEKLTSRDSRILDYVFEALLRFTFEFICDRYGCFVFGMFIESCNDYQLRLVTMKVTAQDKLFLQASSHKFGSSSIKKLIKIVADSLLLYHVMSALKRLFKFMMITKLGSSVIMECLGPLYSHKNDFLYQAALEHCLYLSCHEQGCISINNFINEMKGSQRKQILDLISMNSASLSKNFSGNYVVQHVLKLNDPHLTETICIVLRGRYIDLSLTKCGSFVVQKCFKYQNKVHYIVEEFLNSSQIFQVACDKYGNYVIQTALAETMRPNTLDLHQRLVSKLQQHLTALQMKKYGKNVYVMIATSRLGLT